MRTTLDLDRTVLERLKQRQRREGGSLGRLASELLATALAQTEKNEDASPLAWASKNMRPRVDLSDTDAVHRVMGDRP